MKKKYDVPNNLKPLGTWTYVGYKILFRLPLIGLICAIIFAIDGSNINRRNYARSSIISMIIGIIIIIAYIIFLFILKNNFGELYQNIINDLAKNP